MGESKGSARVPLARMHPGGGRRQSNSKSNSKSNGFASIRLDLELDLGLDLDIWVPNPILDWESNYNCNWIERNCKWIGGLDLKSNAKYNPKSNSKSNWIKVPNTIGLGSWN